MDINKLGLRASSPAKEIRESRDSVNYCYPLRKEHVRPLGHFPAMDTFNLSFKKNDCFYTILILKMWTRL